MSTGQEFSATSGVCGRGNAWSRAESGVNGGDKSDHSTAQIQAIARAPSGMTYAEVAGCIDEVKASGAWPTTNLALEFLVLAACRWGEVREARWEEIDLGALGRTDRTPAAVWEIPAARIKMKRPHRVPLSARALENLREAEAFRDGSGLVFPSPSGRTRAPFGHARHRFLAGGPPS